MKDILTDNAKSELKNKYDKVSDDQISDYINEYMDQKRIDEEIYQDEYIIREEDENIEIIDTGTVY